MAEPKLSELLSKLGYQESDELFSVYNEVEYNQLLSSTLALEAKLEAVDQLQEASIEFYCGVINKETWREAVRQSPKALELIALAFPQEEPEGG